MNTITCTKKYSDLPFAHRQHMHDGHCAMIHGHNWEFEFEFAAEKRDECGFVIDFGKLKWLKAWLEERFDHTLVLNADDPHLSYLQNSLGDDSPMAATPGPFADIFVIPDASCEGLAQYLLAEVGTLVRNQTQGRVWVAKVTVYEDTKNSATAAR